MDQSAHEVDAVRTALEHAQSLESFLKACNPLGFEHCSALLDEAIRLFEGLYVHLPSKRAIYAVDPVRRLRLLKVKLQREEGSGLQFDDLAFHREMVETFTSVRDLHTAYVLPDPFGRALAFLPFQVESCSLDQNSRTQFFVVTNVIEGLDGFDPPDWFRPGIRVTHWNDVGMHRALEIIGSQNAGSNPAARLARGLSRLTIRPLARALPPDEEAVSLRCAGRDGNLLGSLRVEWRIVTLPPQNERVATGSQATAHRTNGIDHEADLIHQLKRPVFSPIHQQLGGKSRLRQGRTAPSATNVKIKHHNPLSVTAALRDFIQASIIGIAGLEYGYMRIRSFNYHGDTDNFIGQIVDLLELMPATGLILDIRDNPGGVALIGERMLQLLTPRTIQPVSVQFINSSLTLQICENLPDLQPWRSSILRAVESGSMFSAALPMSDVEACNDYGQKYHGPSVLIVNGLCFSTADIFAAGFQDHAIGDILGTDERTGAGGADVVVHSALCKRMKDADPDARILTPLTEGAGDFRIAWRRILRVGPHAGMELEDLGVVRDKAYKLTERDVLSHTINPGLIEYAASVVKDQPSYELRDVKGTSEWSNDRIGIDITTRNLERIDVSVDGKWAGQSSLVVDGVNHITVALPPGYGPKFLQLQGFKADKLVAARKIHR